MASVALRQLAVRPIIGVATALSKVVAIRAASRGQLILILITDKATARGAFNAL